MKSFTEMTIGQAYLLNLYFSQPFRLAIVVCHTKHILPYEIKKRF